MIEIGGRPFDARVYKTAGKRGYNAIFRLIDMDAVKEAFRAGGPVSFVYTEGRIELIGVEVLFYHETPENFTVGFAGIDIPEDEVERLDDRIDAQEALTEAQVEELSNAIDDLLVMILEG